MSFTSKEMANTIRACELMKERVSSINAVLFGSPFWQELSKSISNQEEDGGTSIVGLAVVTSVLIPTSHALYFSSIEEAIKMRRTLRLAMEDNGLSWDEVMEVIKDGKRWDREVKLWESNERQ